MAITTDPWDSVELAAYISEEWPGPTNEQFFENAVAVRFFRDLSQFAQQGSDILHVPNVFTNVFSVQTQSTQGTEVTTDAPATVDDTLTIDTHEYIATLLGYLDQQQININYDLGDIYSRKAGGTLLEQVEATIFGLYTNVTTNVVGSTAAVVSDANIRGALEALASAAVPLDEAAFFFHPYTYYQQILAIQKYYEFRQFGGLDSATRTALLGGSGRGVDMADKGELFGVPVLMSNQITNTLLAVRNLLAHKNAFTFAFQTPGGSPVEFRAADWIANLGILSVWHQIYGVAEMREEAAVLINGSNAFIAS